MAALMLVSGDEPIAQAGRWQNKLWGAFAVLWALLAVAPRYRADWAIENILVLLLALIVVLMRGRIALSNTAAISLFIYLCLHEIGAHYTYAQVPYDDWAAWLTGHRVSTLLGWQRNNYDRVVHFASGLLLFVPIREQLCRHAKLSVSVGNWFALSTSIALAACYELVEWFAVLLVGGDLGAAYLGMQGDIWDAQKDVALATGGTLLAMLTTVWRRRRLHALNHAVDMEA